MTRQAPKPGKLTVAEAAAELGVHKTQITRWLNEGHLEHYRYPGRTGDRDGTIRIDRAELDRFLAACKRPAQGRTA